MKSARFENKWQSDENNERGGGSGTFRIGEQKVAKGSSPLFIVSPNVVWVITKLWCRVLLEVFQNRGGNALACRCMSIHCYIAMASPRRSYRVLSRLRRMR